MPAIALAHSALSLDAVRPHAKNYKIHTDRQISQLQESLVRFGQVRSVVVHDAGDGTYTTVAGHGVIEAARRLSWAHITADVLPTEWTEADIRGYLIADNQHGVSAEQDEALLLDLLAEQREGSEAIASLGFSEKELDSLFEEMADQSKNTQRLSYLLGDDDGRTEQQKDVEKALALPAYAGSPDRDEPEDSGENVVEEQRRGRSAREKSPQETPPMVRQIMLVMEQEQYDLFAAIRDAFGATTPMAGFELLLRAFVTQHPDLVFEKQGAVSSE